MRCYCCNRNLSDYESTLKSATTGEYLDTCKKCLEDLNIPVLKNQHDSYASDVEDEDFVEENDEDTTEE
jgi:hypothetical protein